LRHLNDITRGHDDFLSGDAGNEYAADAALFVLKIGDGNGEIKPVPGFRPAIRLSLRLPVGFGIRAKPVRFSAGRLGRNLQHVCKFDCWLPESSLILLRETFGINIASSSIARLWVFE
jgi:hypothetical protein